MSYVIDFVTGEKRESKDVTDNFSESEIACRCCGALPSPNDTMILCLFLEDARKVAGMPLFLTNAYRCEKHNKQVGGENHSHHLLGQAADVYTNKFNSEELCARFERNREIIKGGIGLYATFVHIDMGRKRYWKNLL
jgi:zinc D-Ala-D-Ala carboxypeptidase